MPTNDITRPAKVSELTADQLDLVHGGIIIVGGRSIRSSDAILPVSGLTNIVRGFREAF